MRAVDKFSITSFSHAPDAHAKMYRFSHHPVVTHFILYTKPQCGGFFIQLSAPAAPRPPATSHISTVAAARFPGITHSRPLYTARFCTVSAQSNIYPEKVSPTVRDSPLSPAAGARLFAFPFFPTAGRCCTSLPPFPMTTFLLDGATTMLPACWGWVDVSAKRRRRGHGGDGADGEMW